MKATAQEEFDSADVLRISELCKPDVGPDPVLEGVVAAPEIPWDWRFMRGAPCMTRAIAGLGFASRGSRISALTLRGSLRRSATRSRGSDPASRSSALSVDCAPAAKSLSN